MASHVSVDSRALRAVFQDVSGSRRRFQRQLFLAEGFQEAKQLSPPLPLRNSASLQERTRCQQRLTNSSTPS